jgi:hypothetical protein
MSFKFFLTERNEIQREQAICALSAATSISPLLIDARSNVIKLVGLWILLSEERKTNLRIKLSDVVRGK